VLLVALGLSLLLEALALPWLVIPVSILADVGVLLSYYALTGHWEQWFWWPAWVLVVAAQCVLALRWSLPGPSRQARRLGLAGSLACTAVIVLELALAIVVAVR